MTFNVSSSSSTITTQELEYVLGNMYVDSGTFGALIDGIQGHSSEPNVLTVVDDGDTSLPTLAQGTNMWTPAIWERDFGENIPWPTAWAGQDYVIHINSDHFTDLSFKIDANNNGITSDDPNNYVDLSLEMLIAHEMTHVPQDLKDGIFTEGADALAREEISTDLADKIGNELNPSEHPEVVRGYYGNNANTDGGSTLATVWDDSVAASIPVVQALRSVDQWFQDFFDQHGIARLNGSPLVVDLDSDGVELISLANATNYWDIDEDGFAEKTGWVNTDDGLLAIDKNSDGIIGSHDELFGSMDMDGFTDLASYDTNSDGVIDQYDAQFGDLLIWQDANSNGYSESSELQSLSDWDIVSIDLAGVSEVSYTIAGHDVSHESTVTFADTSTSDIVDAWFDFDNQNTVYSTDYVLDVNALFLPTQRGYGEVTDLHIAMSLDNTGTGNLLDLVGDLADLSFADIFDDTTNLIDDIRDIMFRWAGVDGVAIDSRGDHVDARELEFQEALLGEGFVQRITNGGSSNPGYWGGVDLDEAFDIAHQAIFARLVAQSAGGELFTGDFYYDITTDSLVGVTGLDSTNLNALETEASSASNKTTFWGNVVRMIEETVGTNNLPAADKTALDDAITASDATLDLNDILASLPYNPSGIGDTTSGTSGDDTITGTADHDTLNGLGGNDTLNGSGGHDDINGDAGDDIITGGNGDDYLKGGSGDDEYHYDLSDGNDFIKESGTSSNDDRIVFGSGIDSSDLTITRINNTDLLIDIDTGTQTGSITIEDQFFSTSGKVELIEFDDASTYDLVNQNYTLNGTSGNDNLDGVTSGGLDDDTIYGLGGNDNIDGKGGDDTLYGGDGNDDIYGAADADTIYGDAGDDILEGGAGDDALYGGTGNDTFIGNSGNDSFYYTSGHATIKTSANGSGGTDTIYADAAWVPADAAYLRSGNDMIIQFDADSTITIINQYSGGTLAEYIEFDDTTSVNLATVSVDVMGGSGNDTLNGTSAANIIYGFGGDDTIDGKNDDDLLYGGLGDDYIEGGYGNDLLYGEGGDDEIRGEQGDDTYIYSGGNDIFKEGLGGTDIVEMPDWITGVGDLTFTRNSGDIRDLILTYNGFNSIILDNSVNTTSDSNNFETLRFASGDVALSTINVVTYGTASGETFTGITKGAGEDDIMYGLAGNDTLKGKDGDDVLYGGDGNDTVKGENDNDILYGDLGNDTLEGGAGNDSLYGGAGDDTLKGNGGVDSFYYDGGLDKIYESGSDVDTLYITGGTTINDITITDTGTRDADLVINSGTDEIFLDNIRYINGYVDNVVFDDGFTVDLTGYNSWLNGGSGNDLVAGNSNDNVLIGFAGADTLDADSGADDLHGGAGDDILYGDAGDDQLHGGINDDDLYGGAGTDTLYGGTGADTFFFESGLVSEVDVIKDFSTSDSDVLDISDILSGYDLGVDDITEWVQITDDGTDSTLKVDVDGGANNFVTIATLEGIIGITDEASLETNGYLMAA
ncbi:MAG: type I secretion C-terminal target domain-containing protein [Candidatus Thiodiazotropha sp. (ex Troendleina suluensis)]|nr:type I secretion C-terminal target domain-containing protein [Candidatus Thiodiazotropha sp. (ex Troendleina suluensis)]